MMLKGLINMGRKQATFNLLKPVSITPYYNSQCFAPSFGFRTFFTMQQL